MILRKEMPHTRGFRQVEKWAPLGGQNSMRKRKRRKVQAEQHQETVQLWWEVRRASERTAEELQVSVASWIANVYVCIDLHFCFFFLST